MGDSLATKGFSALSVRRAFQSTLMITFPRARPVST
jgi:hypothetical protein